MNFTKTCLVALVVLSAWSNETVARERTRAKSQNETAEESDSYERTSDRRVASGGKQAESKSSRSVQEIIEKLDYPELQVVPRASERLRIEARDEQYSWYYMHWQMELSGLATAVTGFASQSELRNDLSENEKNDAKTMGTVAQALGAGWMVAGVLIGAQRPYRAGMIMLSKYDGKDVRSAVLRERLAEEALERPARLIGPIRWISVISNLGVNVLTGIYLSDRGRLIAGISALMAFVPLMYEDHVINVYEKQLEYKTKIYGPLSSVAPVYDTQTRTFVPMARLTWTF